MKTVDAIKLAIEALEYHQEQTRPIERTQQTIDTLRNQLQEIDRPISEERLYELEQRGYVTYKSTELRENKFTEQMEYVPVTRTDFSFLRFARVIEKEHGIGVAQ